VSIECLTPSREECGQSPLSHTPPLGFDKEVDNRIKLVEEILSLRIQRVKLDNADMYVDCFFFSSRRRHTRLVSDWSSDVCSSDLARLAPVRARSRPMRRPETAN